MSTAPASGFRSKLNCDLFRGLDKAALDGLLEAATCSCRSPGQLFCRQGSPASSLFVLTSGLVKLVGTSSGGKEVLLGWLYPGQSFGLGAMLTSPSMYVWTARAVQKSEVLEWSNFRLKRLNLLCPRIYENSLRIAIRWAGQLQERLEQMATETVEQRIAHLVTQLTVQGQKRGIVGLDISVEDLAQMAGANLYTVSRLLGRWQRLGLVKKSRRRLEVVCMEELIKIGENARVPSDGVG